MKCCHRRAPDVRQRCALPRFKASTDVKALSRLSKGPLWAGLLWYAMPSAHRSWESHTKVFHLVSSLMVINHLHIITEKTMKGAHTSIGSTRNKQEMDSGEWRDWKDAFYLWGRTLSLSQRLSNSLNNQVSVSVDQDPTQRHIQPQGQHRIHLSKATARARICPIICFLSSFLLLHTCGQLN